MTTAPTIDSSAGRRAVAKDPRFAGIVKLSGPVEARPKARSAFAALASIIVHQQLAGAAARTIHGRFVSVLGGRVTADAVLASSEEALRGAGLSNSKFRAILDLAEKTAAGEVAPSALSRKSDDEVVEHLTRVRGIGEWSAHMFLMFHLRRPDVWPVGDLGVREGWARLHGLDERPDAKALVAAADHLRPWRSIAAWYCWRAAEVRPEG